MLVEYEARGFRLFADWLVHAGFRVEQTQNGLQALERARVAPDTIVTDLPIRGLEGFEPEDLETAVRTLIDERARLQP